MMVLLPNNSNSNNIFNTAAVVCSLQQYGFAVVNTSGVSEGLLTALQAEAAAAWEQAESLLCASEGTPSAEHVARHT